jgi:hypothetical protein
MLSAQRSSTVSLNEPVKGLTTAKIYNEPNRPEFINLSKLLFRDSDSDHCGTSTNLQFLVCNSESIIMRFEDGIVDSNMIRIG